MFGKYLAKKKRFDQKYFDQKVLVANLF